MRLKRSLAKRVSELKVAEAKYSKSTNGKNRSESSQSEWMTGSLKLRTQSVYDTTSLVKLRFPIASGLKNHLDSMIPSPHIRLKLCKMIPAATLTLSESVPNAISILTRRVAAF